MNFLLVKWQLNYSSGFFLLLIMTPEHLCTCYSNPDKLIPKVFRIMTFGIKDAEL